MTLFVVSSMSLVSSCSSDDDGDSANAENFDLFISFRADGELITYGFDQDNFDTEFQPSISFTEFLGNSSCFRSCSPGLISVNDSALPQAEVSFNRFLDAFCTSDDPAIFNTLFPVGTYEYSNNGERGVGFGFGLDTSDNAFYDSEEGMQSGSSFSITASEEDNITFAGGVLYGQIVSGTFNCTVYNELDTNDSIEITEGVYRLRVESDN